MNTSGRPASPPILSVLTTVYNREKYLDECIESVLASSFTNFEYIIVDDCSTDRSFNIATDYAKQDSRIRVYRNERNLGDYPNRNRAALLARGKYLKFVDSDDYIYAHGLEVMVSMISQNPEAGVALGALQQHATRPFPVLLTPREAFWRHYWVDGIFNRSPLSSIIRAEAFKIVGGFTGMELVGDFELWHILASRYPVVIIPPGLAWYRHHPSQEMQAARTNVAKLFAYSVVSTEFLRSVTCPLGERERETTLRRVRRGQWKAILRAAMCGRVRSAVEMCSTMRDRKTACE